MIKFIYIFLTLAVVAGCNPSTMSPATTPTAEEETIYNVSGMFQKGPLIQGSAISISELDNDLNSSGAIYSTAIMDDYGNYEFNGKIKSRFVSIEGEGYFQNEITGTLSSSTIRMQALADLEPDETISVNLVTTLSIERTKYLVANGLRLVDALDQAFDEVLNAFNIEPLAEYDNINILEQTEASKIALAISVISLQLAKNDEQDAGSFEAAFSNFISKFNTDLKVDGEIGSNFDLDAKITAASANIDVATIKSNIQAIMDFLGITGSVPNFEEYIDLDSDGILEKDDDNIPDLVVIDSIAGLDYRAPFLSNVVTISGLADFGFSIVNPPLGIQAILNGTELSESTFIVVNGDEIQLQGVSGAFGAVDTYSLVIGESETLFSVSTRNLLTIPIQDIVNSVVSSDGQTVFVLDRVSGLLIYDLSGISPVLVGNYPEDGALVDINLSPSGKFVYFTDFHYGLFAINVEDLTSPTLVGQYTGNAEYFSISDDESELYLARGLTYFTKYNIDSNGALTTDYSVTTGQWTMDTDLSADGSLLVVANREYGFLAYETSTGNLLSRYLDANYAGRVTLSESGTLALVANQSFNYGLDIIDLTTPTTPESRGKIQVVAYDSAFSKNMNYIFVGTSSGLSVYDIRDLTNIILVKEYSIGQVSNLSLTSAGDKILLTLYTGFSVMNLSPEYYQ